MSLCIQNMMTLRSGFPIRKSTDQSLLTAPHGLSQRATSFIASQCQGIHQMPLRHLIVLITTMHHKCGHGVCDQFATGFAYQRQDQLLKFIRFTYHLSGGIVHLSARFLAAAMRTGKSLLNNVKQHKKPSSRSTVAGLQADLSEWAEYTPTSSRGKPECRK